MAILLETRIEPTWDAVKSAWDICYQALQKAGLKPDETDALSMAAHELLENAVKYGAFSPGDRIGLRIAREPSGIVVEVRHPVGSSAELRRLDETIQWIRGFQDPFEAYVEKMKEVSSHRWAPGQSGLGLARVAYEGQCILDFYVDESNILSFSAVYRS